MSGCCILGTILENGNPYIICRVVNIDFLDARNIINYACKFINGKGGGKKDIAEGGGKNGENLQLAIDETKKWVENIIKEKDKI